MKSKDGGAAFPGTDENTEARHRGMSLRDYFAAKAMQVSQDRVKYCQADWDAPQKEWSPWNIAKRDAELAYIYADAMLKAREVDHD